MTEIERRQPTELERQEHWERGANDLIERYAGFTDAENLTEAEKVIALVSIVPMALQVVEEARDTIERLNEENDKAYERGYKDGGTDVNSDWHSALSEVVEDRELDTWRPSIVAAYVERLEGSRELLIEALARLEALDMLPGDPGGPFYVRDAGDLMMSMRWISAVRTDPPTWDDDGDPLEAAWDWEKDEATWKLVSDRADELLKRIRRELVAYHERVKASNPTHSWRPWWRTRR